MLRFAPSPTGFLHFGNIRVALLNFLFAKKNNLNFFLRIDDTDKERSKDQFTSSIVEDLKWLGIEYFKIIKQSERLEKYKDIFKFLKNKNLIYPCFESSDELSFKRKILLKQGKPPIYDRSSLNLTKSEITSKIQSGINPYWRLKLDERPIEWNDLIHGKITFNNLSVSDPVIFRSDEMPLFTITSVVDDAEMRVSHVFRGDDHITNTAAQIKLFKSIDASIPDFGHFPLIKSKTGEGLSKRSNSLSIKEFKEKKIFKIIILNYLNKIGTNQSIEEIQDFDSLVKSFDLKKFSKNSIFFDPSDIERLNAKYIKSIDFEKLEKNYSTGIDIKLWEVIKSNIDSIDEALEWKKLIKGKFNLEHKIIVEKNLKKIIKDCVPSNINNSFWELWTNKILKEFDIKPGKLYVTIRKILTGKKFGPSMNDLLTLMEKDEIIRRVDFNCEEED